MFALLAAADADVGLLFLILAILAFAGAVYLAVVAHNYVGALVALLIGVVLLVVT